MNEREAFRNYLQNGVRIGESMEKTFKAGFQAGLSSQAHLRYLVDTQSGEFTVMQSQAQQSQWISVEEAKTALKDGDFIYVAFQNKKVSEAVYKFEQGFYPHRIISDYGNERIEHCTHVMRRKVVPLPPAPEGDEP